MTYNIASFFNGAGDILQLSTLPERLSKEGHTVNLYKGSKVNPFRNPELKKFFWDRNPYIKGETTESWTCGDIPGLPYKNTTNAFISNWEAMFGLKPPYNELPIIYYEPKIIPGIEGIIELSSITLKYNKEDIIAKVQEIITESGANFRQIINPNQSNPIIIPGVKTITTSSLEELSNIIHNCTIFISLNSGSHSLEAAIQRFGNKREHISFIPHKDYNWIMELRKFIYPNIKYIKAG